MGVINKKSVFDSLYIFLAARAGVAGIAPFGPAAFAIAVMSHDMSYGFIGIILYSFACIIGSLTTGVWQQTVISTVTIILFIFAYYFIKNSIQQEYPFVLKCAVALGKRQFALEILPNTVLELALDRSHIYKLEEEEPAKKRWFGR